MCRALGSILNGGLPGTRNAKVLYMRDLSSDSTTTIFLLDFRELKGLG